GFDANATATVTQVSPLQYTITFGGSLAGRNLTPDPYFSAFEQGGTSLVNGSVLLATTTQGAGLVNQDQSSPPLPTVGKIVDGVGTEQVQLQLNGPISGGNFQIRYEIETGGANWTLTQTINWSPDPVVMTGNIQTALNNMFGTGRTKVFLNTLGDS